MPNLIEVQKNSYQWFRDKGLQEVLDAGEAYETYTQVAENVNGSVKFIYKTEGIK